MKFILIIILFAFLPSAFFSAEEPDEFMYGVTLTSVTRLPETVEALSKLHKKPTSRIVFDPWVYPEHYGEAVDQISKVSYIMGEILDSYSFQEYDLKNYKERVTQYVNYFPDKVDIWEIGNEVNGDWLGDPKDVSEKLNAAYDIVKAKNKKTAITFYYNYNCTGDPETEMFNWIQRNIRNKIRTGTDYVFVSYYEDECITTEPDWDTIFKYLQVMFPNAKLGIGECGTRDKGNSEELMKKYYDIKVSNPKFIGGYFWWYFKRDCVPYTKPGWQVLQDIIISNHK
jgi:hypothetical protein